MLLKHWNTIVLSIAIFKSIWALNCNNQSICLVKPGNDSFNKQVIEAAIHYHNASFTILVYAGDYNATTGTTMNFNNFTNVTIKKHPDNARPVNIMCPKFTNKTHNGIGFIFCRNIKISGLNFMNCGPITSGLYFLYTRDIDISNSSFHHHSDNGIQIQFGDNITITDCDFFFNIGLQPDSLSDIILQDTFTRGSGIGLVFENQSNVSVTIKGCNFKNNIAFKDVGYNSSAETRPYGFIPFGNGGGLYMNLYKVKNAYITVSNCNFYNNTAIHQGGAIVMIPLNSTDTKLNITGCKFIGNKVLGYFLRSLPIPDIKSNHSIDNFIDMIANTFSLKNFDFDSLNNLTFSKLASSGGFGGAIAVSLFGSVERNVLYISNSRFTGNLAFSAGAIGFIVRDLLGNVENGVDSNQAFVNKYATKYYMN